ncbi:MAG: DUF47 family protein [Tissierellia bacterium]|nr:DUF47 family protein [Tissierellia bacterium]
MLKEYRFDYFKNFEDMSAVTLEIAKMLDDCLKDFSPDNMEEILKEFHEVEHRGDELMHSTLNRLAKEFLPPIEREDIVFLVHRLDDVTDNIEDIAMALYMYNVQELLPETLEFSSLLLEGAGILSEVTKEFVNFKKANDIKEKIISVNTLEEKGDLLYMQTLRNLYENFETPKELIIWTRVIDKMEKTLDSMEFCSNVMESIILKNS